MNPFQERCGKAIGDVVSRHLMKIGLEEYPATQEGGPDGMFLQGQLVHTTGNYKIFVYPDGAGARVANNWYVLEGQDYDSEDELIQTFCDFLGQCLKGTHPVAAIQAAKEARR